MEHPFMKSGPERPNTPIEPAGSEPEQAASEPERAASEPEQAVSEPEWAVSEAEQAVSEAEQAACGQGKTPAPSGGFKSIAAGLGYFGVYLLMQLVVSAIAAMVAAIQAALSVGTGDFAALMTEIAARITAAALPLTLAVNAATLLTVWLMFLVRKKKFALEIRLARVPFSRLAPLIPLGILLNVLLSSILSLLPASWLAAYEAATDTLLQNGAGAFAALMIAVLAPVTEEVLFRGLIYTRFSAGMPRWAAMGVSALLFGVMHGQPVWMVYAACFGVLLCLVMERYDSLLAAIVLHVAFNAGSLFAALLSGVPVYVGIPVCAVLIAGLMIRIRRKNE